MAALQRGHFEKGHLQEELGKEGKVGRKQRKRYRRQSESNTRLKLNTNTGKRLKKTRREEECMDDKV